MNNANDLLNILSNIVQLFSYQENLAQTSNDQIMKALEEQNEKYFKEIIGRLERLENGNIKRT